MVKLLVVYGLRMGTKNLASVYDSYAAMIGLSGTKCLCTLRRPDTKAAFEPVGFRSEASSAFIITRTFELLMNRVTLSSTLV